MQVSTLSVWIYIGDIYIYTHTYTHTHTHTHRDIFLLLINSVPTYASTFVHALNCTIFRDYFILYMYMHGSILYFSHIFQTILINNISTRLLKNKYESEVCIIFILIIWIYVN